MSNVLVQQLPTLLGVITGALATYAATSAAERGRWRRQQAVRWDERKLEAYTAYAHVLKKAISASVQLAGSRGIHDENIGSPATDPLVVLAGAEEERTVAWEAVLLLGSSEVVLAGRRWHQGYFKLQRLAVGLTADVTWEAALHATSQARREFYEAARLDMGISAVSSPETLEWQIAKKARAESGEVTLAAAEQSEVGEAAG
jgi:hypothetical protein